MLRPSPIHGRRGRSPSINWSFYFFECSVVRTRSPGTQPGGLGPASPLVGSTSPGTRESAASLRRRAPSEQR